jgi:hypothetical protein
MSINEIFGRIANQRGFKAEERVENVMRSNLENNNLPDWILGYEKACEQDDYRGVDGWIYTRDVGKLKLQIKSSQRGKNEFMKRHRWQDTAILVISRQDSSETILDKVISSIIPLRQKYLSKRSNL